MTEKQVGNNAKKMIFDALKSQINTQNFADSDSDKNRKNKYGQRLTPLKHSTTHVRMFRNKKDQLRGIAIHMGVHGFVHNFGVDGPRRTHSTTSKKNKEYTRRVHQFKLRKRNFIPSLIQTSGTIDYLSRQIPVIRGEEVVAQIKQSFK